jgi:hypothetical protein
MSDALVDVLVEEARVVLTIVEVLVAEVESTGKTQS